MSIFDSIDSPSDVKALPLEDLDALCSELRDFIIKSVSKTGGHLSSNLGVVELTVAVHRVFDTTKDRLIFDVGHQSYVHKLLTGRKSRFDTLRKMGGLAGFPKPAESVHDAFIAGHASNSISIALGMAHARTLSRGEYQIIAIIGDGALTGGLAFEGLSNAGGSGERMVIILNDNGMSITNNVGGIARYLSRQRMKPSYATFKKRYKRLMEILPGGRAVYRFIHSIKTMVKEAILNCSMFEDMGLQYSGPIDGYNIKRVIEALEWAKRQNGPVVVHVLTQKGKGYEFAEQSPEKYHGVRPFNYRTGVKGSKERTFSSIFGDELIKLAGRDPRICAITASMTDGTGLDGFAARFPERFFDVGIAEGHAVAMAAGLASRGAVPVFAVYSTFLQRAYDMLIHDVAISGLHVVLAVDRVGLVPGDGETHQGLFDAAFLPSIPGMTVLCPASFAELRDMLRFAVDKAAGPAAVRYPRGSEGAYKDGGADAAKCVREGSDFTLVTYGTSINTAIEAADMLEKDEVFVEIIKLGCINPIEIGIIVNSVAKTKRLLVLEECAGRGSVGESIIALLSRSSKEGDRRARPSGRKRAAATIAGGTENRKNRIPKSVILLNTDDFFAPSGEIEELRKLCGIDAQSVYNAIKMEMRIQSTGVRDEKDPA